MEIIKTKDGKRLRKAIIDGVVYCTFCWKMLRSKDHNCLCGKARVKGNNLLRPLKSPSNSLPSDWGYKCAYCEKDIGIKGTRDHFIPKDKGGRDDKNLVYSCRDCNLNKKNIDPRKILSVWFKLNPDDLEKEYKKLKEEEK